MTKKKLPTEWDVINKAIKCGPIPKKRDISAWKTKPYDKLSKGEEVCRFALDYLVVPEGPFQGEPLELNPFQVAFILSIFDSKHHIRTAILSVGRRNGKSALIGAILLAAIIGPTAVRNSVVASAALSRDQAGLVFRLMVLMLDNPDLAGLYKVVPSSKTIVGLKKNVHFHALASEAKSGMGKSLMYILLDESGQIGASTTDYIQMLTSSQGSYPGTARFFTVSTQAPADASFLSLEIDSAIRDQPKDVVCHVYAADEDFDIDDRAQWHYANPALGLYRSIEDMEMQVEQAKRLPAKMPGVLNLLFNQRVSMDSLFCAPNIWRDNTREPNLEAFRTGTVCLGLDLSMINDLTVAVIATQDDHGEYHALCFPFSPLGGIDARSSRDKVPYNEWARTGKLYAPPGETLNYDMVATFLRDQLEDLGIEVHRVLFDRYRMDQFKASAERAEFLTDCEFVPVGQGFVSFGKVLDFFETILLSKGLHQAHPVLNLAASSAIVEQDHTGQRRLSKPRSAAKIDGFIALGQALWGFAESNDVPDDVTSWIG